MIRREDESPPGFVIEINSWLSLWESWHAVRRDSAPEGAFRSATVRSTAFGVEMRGKYPLRPFGASFPKGEARGNSNDKTVCLSAFPKLALFLLFKICYTNSTRK